MDIQDLEHVISIDNTQIRTISDNTNTNNIQSNQGRFLPSREDVERSSSGRSKRDWKERMRKKHLPPIFVNEGYDDKSPTAEEQKVRILTKGGPANISGNSLHFYMSSDYHPDCLTESLPRNKLRKGPSMESETGAPYTNTDIDEVLDIDSLTDIQIVRAKTAHAYKTETNVNTFSTFKSDPNEDKQTHSKGVYNTFEDLSKIHLREESEIHFDAGEIPIDDIDDGYNSPNVSEQYTSRVSTLNYATPQMHFTSFKPDDDMCLESGGKNLVGIRMDDIEKSIFVDSKDVQFEMTSFRTSQKRKDTEHNQSNDKPSKPTRTASHLQKSNCVHKDATTRLSKHKPLVSNYPQPGGVLLDASPIFEYQTKDAQTNSQINYGDSSGFSISGIDLYSEDVNRDEKESVVQKQDNSIDDENASSGSSSSITVSPYKGEVRRRPWMEDIDIQNDEHSQMGEPLVHDSDTDTLKDSHESSELRYGYSFDPRYAGSTHSGLSTPVSSIFDEETDRGFEEALEMHINPGANVYGGVGLCFESIKEEPEDITSSGSNPFLENASNGEDEFRTQAVISRSSNSRTSSTTSMSDNPFSSSPTTSHNKDTFNSIISNRQTCLTPVIITTDADAEFGDSGFTSGLERGNTSDSSGHQEFTPRGRTSPWPEEEVNRNLEMSFETNFCEESKCLNNTAPHNSSTTTNHNQYDLSSSTRWGSFKRDDNKKLVNKALEVVRSENRPHPVRAKSLERSSPLSARKPARRGHSFEETRMDVKPAYF